MQSLNICFVFFVLCSKHTDDSLSEAKVQLHFYLSNSISLFPLNRFLLLPIRLATTTFFLSLRRNQNLMREFAKVLLRKEKEKKLAVPEKTNCVCGPTLELGRTVDAQNWAFGNASLELVGRAGLHSLSDDFPSTQSNGRN